MVTGQGKPGPEQVTRYLELERYQPGWVRLTIVSEGERASILLPVHRVREVKRFADLVASAGELLFRSDYHRKG